MADPENENENDPYAEYDQEDRAGMQAEGAANALAAIERVIGDREMANLKERIAGAVDDPLIVKDEKDWSRNDWGDAFASGRKNWSEIPEDVRRQMDLKA